MSTWHYRILRYADGGYGLHEVYCDAGGKPDSWTLEPVGFGVNEEEGPEGVVKALRMALADAAQRPPLQIPDTWPELVDALHGEQTLAALSEPETIGVLKLNTRFASALWCNGVKSLDDLTSLSEWELRRIPNIGRLSAGVIKTKLAERGLRLADDETARLRVERELIKKSRATSELEAMPAWKRKAIRRAAGMPVRRKLEVSEGR